MRFEKRVAFPLLSAAADICSCNLQGECYNPPRLSQWRYQEVLIRNRNRELK
jgi:hypothetical protein